MPLMARLPRLLGLLETWPIAAQTSGVLRKMGAGLAAFCCSVSYPRGPSVYALPPPSHCLRWH